MAYNCFIFIIYFFHKHMYIFFFFFLIPKRALNLIINKNVKLQYPTTILWQADISVKNQQNLPISNPKPKLHNINAHTKFGENPLILTQVIDLKKRKLRSCGRQITLSKIDKICPLTIPNHSLLIYMCTQNLNKIHHQQFKLEIRNQALTD